MFRVGVSMSTQPLEIGEIALLSAFSLVAFSLSPRVRVAEPPFSVATRFLSVCTAVLRPMIFSRGLLAPFWGISETRSSRIGLRRLRCGFNHFLTFTGPEVVAGVVFSPMVRDACGCSDLGVASLSGVPISPFLGCILQVIYHPTVCVFSSSRSSPSPLLFLPS